MSVVKIEDIAGVGKKYTKIFNENKIYTTYDLIRFFPHTYESFKLAKFDELTDNKEVTIKVKVISEVIISITKNILFATFFISHLNQKIKVIAFNQKFISNVLKNGDIVYLKGKIDYKNKSLILSKIVKLDEYSEIVPIYKIEGISNKVITKIIKRVLLEDKVTVSEILPEKIIKKHNLETRYKSYKKIHFPSNTKEIVEAELYLKYEEAYEFLKEVNTRINLKRKREPKKYDINKVKTMIDSISFELTKDQKNAVNDIFNDFKGDKTAYRLIQGDVGSGKTIVSLIASYGVLTAFEQVAIMAPTEVLARQHYESFNKIIKDYRVALLSSDVKNKDEIKKKLESGEIDLVIGTHSLAEENVIFKNLGLVIIDEQHKFGVNTRNKLLKKSEKADLIYMSATPIPRTMAIAIFGDVDISSIKSKPNNRKDVKTEIFLDSEIEKIHDEIEKTLNKNEKIYVVVPAIESEHAKYNILNMYEDLLKKFGHSSVFKIHGKMKKNLIEDSLKAFIKAKRGILLATSMIEVGIDVKEATLIIIFGSEYFGLSQLHQLRGRVGRNEKESKCILVATSLDKKRLNIIESSNNGFEISIEDLKLRGTGNFLGLEQTGNYSLKYLDFIEDFEIIENVKNEM